MYVRRTYIHCRLYINYLQFSCLTNFSVWLFFCFAIFSSSLTTRRHLLGQWMNMKYKYCDKIKHKQQISHLCSDWINYTHISKFCSTCYGGGGDSFFFYKLNTQCVRYVWNSRFCFYAIFYSRLLNRKLYGFVLLLL